MAVSTRNSVPAFVERLDVYSNPTQEKSVSLANGFVRLMYYESILQDSIRVTYSFTDTGGAINDKTSIDGLPIVGQEKVYLKIKDNNDVTLEFGDKKNNHLYVNKVTPLTDDSNKSLANLDLVSKEYIMNEKFRLNTRFNGKISEHVNKILTEKDYFATKKKVDIEDTSNNYNFLGQNKKGYYTINWLCKYAVPGTINAAGNTAGFMLYETSEGFHFKSVDSLFSQKKKKSIIFNQSSEGTGESIPEGYDIKALSYEHDNAVNVQNKLKMGAYSTRIVMFNPFDCRYEVVTPNAKQVEEKDGIKTAGKKLPVLNKEFDRDQKNKEFSRTTYMLLDTGTLPDGSGTGKGQEQIKKSKEENLEAKKIVNQGIMRMNQLFSEKTSVVIPGDFSLHAGDAIFVDAPQLTADKTDDVNKESGGLYIIADLCHYISPQETYTKINLIRDSFGRKGKPT